MRPAAILWWLPVSVTEWLLGWTLSYPLLDPGQVSDPSTLAS